MAETIDHNNPSWILFVVDALILPFRHPPAMPRRGDPILATIALRSVDRLLLVDPITFVFLALTHGDTHNYREYYHYYYYRY